MALRNIISICIKIHLMPHHATISNKFMDNFRSNKDPSSGSVRYHSRHQGPSEPLTHYLYEKHFLADSYDPAMKFNELLICAVSNMHRQNIFLLVNQVIASFDQLIESAIIHEKAQAMVQRRRTETQTPTSPRPPLVTTDAVNDITSRRDQLLLLNTYTNSTTNHSAWLTASLSKKNTSRSTSPSPRKCCHCSTTSFPLPPCNCSHHHSSSSPSSRSVLPACVCPAHNDQYPKTANSYRERSSSSHPRNHLKFSNNKRSKSNPGK